MCCANIILLLPELRWLQKVVSQRNLTGFLLECCDCAVHKNHRGKDGCLAGGGREGNPGKVGLDKWFANQMQVRCLRPGAPGPSFVSGQRFPRGRQRGTGFLPAGAETWGNGVELARSLAAGWPQSGPGPSYNDIQYLGDGVELRVTRQSFTGLSRGPDRAGGKCQGQWGPQGSGQQGGGGT